jgi:hypothetical protein
MSDAPNRESFESIDASRAHWDIGEPQPVSLVVAGR